MIEVQSPKDLQQALVERPRPVGLVPLTFDLHEGHLSLLNNARAANATVVVSLFNQVMMGSDLSEVRFPNDPEKDKELLSEAGASFLYNAGPFPSPSICQIEIETLSSCWEGIRYPKHFRRVATTVYKLLSEVNPSNVYFGEKDFQQFRVITELANCFFPQIQVQSCPTVRDSNGLALSTSNCYLSASGQEKAGHLFKTLVHAQKLVEAGEYNTDDLCEIIIQNLNRNGLQVDYVGIVDPLTLTPLAVVERESRILVAAFLENIRLTDTIALSPAMTK